MSDKQNHKKWRKKFREGVYKRDNYACRKCGQKDGDLDAHHITDRHELPNGGYVLSNGITLCEPCHIKAGKHHITGGKEWETGFHPNDLYDMICSSLIKAEEDSLSLTNFKNRI